MIQRVKSVFIVLVVLLIVSLSLDATIVLADSPQDALFQQDSTEFNLDLATFSLSLCQAAYGDTSANVEKALASYGFVNDTVYDSGSYKNSSRLGTDLVGYSFAHKRIICGGKDFTLVSVVIRGTSGDSEWLSNFNINDSGSSPAIHEGFRKAEKSLLASLNNYVKSLNSDKTDTKFLITGHSRGAAVANLLAADLSQSEQLAAQSNIYGYTFATPNVAKIASNNYLNIFNAVNPADIVTEIPLAKWGYSRYGVTYSLPDISQVNGETLAATQKILSQLQSMAPTVQDFYNAKLSLLFLKENLIPAGTANVHAPQAYMKQLTTEDPDKLLKVISDLQLKLLPDTNYA